MRGHMFKDKSKIIFFSDMDGTLLSKDKTLSKRNSDPWIRIIHHILKLVNCFLLLGSQ